MKLNQIDEEVITNPFGAVLAIVAGEHVPTDNPIGETLPYKLREKLVDKELQLYCVESLGEINARLINTYKFVADKLFEMKGKFKARSGAWTELLDSGLLGISSAAVRDLLHAREYLHRVNEWDDYPEFKRQVLGTASFRTVRIISDQESKVQGELIRLAEAGEQLTEPLVKSVVNGTKPVSKLHREIRKEVKDQRFSEWRSTEKVANNDSNSFFSRVSLDIHELQEDLVAWDQQVERFVPPNPKEFWKPTPGKCVDDASKLIADVVRSGMLETDALVQIQELVQSQLLLRVEESKEVDPEAIDVQVL